MLNKLIEDNYDNILIHANRITRKRNRHQSKALINETYLMLSEKELTPEQASSIKYFVKTMFYMYRGERSRYSKAERVNSIYLDYDPGNEDWTSIELILDENEDTKDEIVNLSHLGKEKAIKYVELMQLKETLPPHEKEIFSLHFEHEQSSRDIAKKVSSETGWDISHMTYNKLINQVKDKIKR